MGIDLIFWHHINYCNEQNNGLMLDGQIRVGIGEKFLGKYEGKWNLSKDTVAF